MCAPRAASQDRVAPGGIESAWSLSLNPPRFERRWRSTFDRYVNSIVGLKPVSDGASIDVLRVLELVLRIVGLPSIGAAAHTREGTDIVVNPLSVCLRGRSEERCFGVKTVSYMRQGPTHGVRVHRGLRRRATGRGAREMCQPLRNPRRPPPTVGRDPGAHGARHCAIYAGRAFAIVGESSLCPFRI